MDIAIAVCCISLCFVLALIPAGKWRHLNNRLRGLRARMSRWSRGPWVHTRSGAKWYICTPRADELDLTDLGACAWINRYGGHAGTCSVAEHQVRCAEYLGAMGHSDWIQLQAATHDVHEALPPGDVAGPAYHGPWWIRWPLRIWSRRVERAVREALGLPAELSPAVHRVDRIMLATEMHDRFPTALLDKDFLGRLPPPVRTVQIPWDHDYAEYRWWSLVSRLAYNVSVGKDVDLTTVQRTRLAQFAHVAHQEARRLRPVVDAR